MKPRRQQINSKNVASPVPYHYREEKVSRVSASKQRQTFPGRRTRTVLASHLHATDESGDTDAAAEHGEALVGSAPPRRDKG
eukprot:scaffold101_cov230-Pinguiococcus_pyrenoidosus.AAC.14